jgi:hypothetical protein
LKNIPFGIIPFGIILFFELKKGKCHRAIPFLIELWQRLLHHHLLAVLDDDALVVSINLLTGEVVADRCYGDFLVKFSKSRC